jgi:hypothetical protein
LFIKTALTSAFKASSFFASGQLSCKKSVDEKRKEGNNDRGKVEKCRIYEKIGLKTYS